MFYLIPQVQAIALLLDGLMGGWGWILISRYQLGSVYRWGWGLWIVIMMITTQFMFAEPAGTTSLDWSTLVATVGYLWHLLLVPGLLVGGLLLGLLDFGRWALASVRPKEIKNVSQPSRRIFLRTLLAAAPSLSMAGADWAWIQLNGFRVRYLEVTFAHLPEGLDGFTIAHLSDVHIGRFSSMRLLGRIADCANDLKTDLIVMTGDLTNYSQEALPEGIEFIRRLRAPLGVYLCEGNHDIIEGAEKFRKAIKTAGLKLLVREAETIIYQKHGGNQVPIQLIGTPWMGAWYRKTESVEEASSQVTGFQHLYDDLAPFVDPEAFNLLLSHHPHSWEAARSLGIDLTLSGHTHGGQIMLDDNRGFGPLLFRYWSGHYQQDGRSLVVSNGVGNWFPLRIHAPAEIIHLTLRKAGATTQPV